MFKTILLIIISFLILDFLIGFFRGVLREILNYQTTKEEWERKIKVLEKNNEIES